MAMDRILFGIATEFTREDIEKEHGWILNESETFHAGYRFARDWVLFTDKRAIFIDVQGLTGKKKEYLSIPYSKVTKFAVESPGPFDMDVDLKLWVGSDPVPTVKKVRFDTKVQPILKILSTYVLEH